MRVKALTQSQFDSLYRKRTLTRVWCFTTLNDDLVILAMQCYVGEFTCAQFPRCYAVHRRILTSQIHAPRYVSQIVTTDCFRSSNTCSCNAVLNICQSIWPSMSNELYKLKNLSRKVINPPLPLTFTHDDCTVFAVFGRHHKIKKHSD